MGGLTGVLKAMDKKKSATILGLDTSTKNIAFCSLERGEPNVLKGAGIVKFPEGSGQDERFKLINVVIPWMMNEYHPDIVVIEQPIYVSNFKVSRVLSYVVGHVSGEILHYDAKLYEVGPLAWKANLGAKNVTKVDKQKWAKTMNAKEVKKKAAFERKDRTRRIIKKMIPAMKEYEDDNIFDAVGIAIWGAQNC